MKQRGVEVAVFAVTGISVIRKLDIFTADDPRVLTGQEHKGPFPATAVMRFRRIGQVYHNRIIQHGAIAFRHGIQLFHEVMDKLEVEFTDLDHTFSRGKAFESAAMTNAVFVEADTQPMEPDAEKRIPHARGDGDRIGQPANQEAAAISNWASSRSDSTSDLNLSVTSGAFFFSVPSISPSRLWRFRISS